MSEHMPDDLSIKGQGLRAFIDKLRTKHPVVKNIANEGYDLNMLM